jgi:multiple sugar transport system substrate-binding protein
MRNPKAFREIAQYEGRMYGVPNIMKVFVLNWRPDHYRAAGIKEPPKTWDELVEVGKKLTIDKNDDGTPDQWALIYPSDESYVTYTLRSFLYNIGGDFLDETGKINVVSPKMKTALQFLVDLRNKHKIAPPLVTQIEYIKMVDQFSRGNISNTIFGFELMTQPAVFSVSKELSQAPLPAGPGGTLGATQAQFEIVGMNPYSKKKAAAALYLDVRRSRQSARYELIDERNDSWYLPVFDEPEVAKVVPNVEVLKLSTERAKSPAFEFNNEVMQILSKEAMNAQLGTKSVDQALQDTQKKIDSLIAY